MPISEDQMTKMQAKRKKILEQAILLFSEHGYNDTTIAKVAKASGVSFGSVFTYFPTKDDLFHQAVMEPLEEISKLLLDFDENASNPLEELEEMVTMHIKIFSEVNKYLRLVVQVIGQYTRFENQFKELDQFHNTFREKIQILVKNGQTKNQLKQLDTHFTVTSYTSLLIGLRVNLADEPDEEYWLKFVPSAMQIFGPMDT
ncbi:TetR/AcrR family transcriptional regulator [Bacillus suaedaesalsae]|uniref:TetR/AcrR family transcriptional regulator n=1 Tax=Bacillus suaedaesalsae TaxID=2810349 RepID=A0ABS2DPH1_9BACI|nr:TetR/AcrR family transcriptional regulator [Bacillus suaedaesalsae]MBM6619586.1 TetR/AcrR family transcriptional regulator [Bacillus suaedaesalsae]